MLRRQRTILKLLSTAGGSLSTTQLQKLLFLLKRETFLRSDSAFYEFLPYKFGPYSFAANREVEALVAYGYVEESAGTSKSLTVTSLGKREGNVTEADVQRAVLVTISKYGQMSARGLMKDVYSRYPWYASKTEAKDLVPEGAVPTLKTAHVAVYTMGYEDRSIDAFFEKLLRAGIRRVIDVRSNPVSRKFGFARSSMSSIAGKLALDYVHRPELGITSEKRKGVESSSDLRRLFGYYEQQILATKRDEIQEIAVLMKESPSVLVCMEKEAVDCHRSRLATRVAAVSDLKIVHL